MRTTALLLTAVLFLLCLLPGTPALAAEVYEAPKQIVITFTGDCTLGCDIPQRGQSTSFEAYVEAYGLEYPFAMVKEIFEQDDLTVINLEGTFKDDDTYKRTYEKGGYNFRAPTSYAQILPLSGIEAVSFANNHVLDYGAVGQESTIKALEAQGTAWFGTNEFADQTYIYEKDGVKIGFIAAYQSDWLNTSFNIRAALEADCQALRAAGCAVIIACMHGGVEYACFHDSGGYQEKFANALIRYGADIVVGHHPHTIQGMHVENGRTILWSLGNFCFGGNPQIRENGMGESVISAYIAQFTLSFDENGAYLGHQLNIIPCHTSGVREYNDYQPHPVSGWDAEVVMNAIRRDTTPYSVRNSLQPYEDGVGAIQDFVPAP